MECLKELGHPSFEPFLLPYYDDRVAYVECSRGHKSALLVQSLKFEVLLESGAKALLAGFTLEAAASFSSGLERCYEFALKVLLLRRDMELVIYDAMFKEMSRQSERQLGAFLALYALEFGESYVVNKKTTEFRNAVIHKGLIPTAEEARVFCTNVYGDVFALVQRLRTNCASEINTAIQLDLGARTKTLPPNTSVATSTGTMFFSLAQSEIKSTFSDALAAYEKARKLIIDSTPHFEALHRELMRKLRENS
jgi:hypothetical protein